MPPSLRCPNVIPSNSCLNHLRQAVNPSSRLFSTTPQNAERNHTRARRQFWHWLNTRGTNFRNPLAGSTNYLGAYTKDGQLKRVVIANRQKERERATKEAAEAAGREYTPPKADPLLPKELPDTPAEQKGSIWKLKKAAKEKAAGTAGDDATIESIPGEDAPVVEELPPEMQSDLTPFPLNHAFKSQPVLTDKFRKKIWEAVMLEGKTVRQVSAEYKVEMSRVGAVVRLIEVQKEWERIGKPQATPYAEAVLGMLPKTPFLEDQENIKFGKRAHESINDLPVHRATGQQIFHPTSESRVFTRADAAKVFHDDLLPADDRVPHPELAILHKEELEDLPAHVRARRAAERAEAEAKVQEKAALQRAKEQARVKKVDTGKWEYRFTEIMVDHAGATGRGRKGTGWRYGAPHMDRSKGAVRIPTSVE